MTSKHSKKLTCKKLKNNLEPQVKTREQFVKPLLPPPPPAPPLPPPIESNCHGIPILNQLTYSTNITENFNNNNTKTTEEDEDESDYDYDFYLMTGRRRHRHHNKINRYAESEEFLTDNTNLSDSQTGSIPSVSLNSNYIYGI